MKTRFFSLLSPIFCLQVFAFAGPDSISHPELRRSVLDAFSYKIIARTQASGTPSNSDPLLTEGQASISAFSDTAGRLQSVEWATTALEKDTSDDVVTLAPIVVGEERIPSFEQRPESRVEKLFRTGTVAEHIGKKVTTKLWLDGDRGLMMSISW